MLGTLNIKDGAGLSANTGTAGSLALLVTKLLRIQLQSGIIEMPGGLDDTQGAMSDPGDRLYAGDAE